MTKSMRAHCTKSRPLGLNAVIGTTFLAAPVIFFGETFLLQSITPYQWLAGSNYHLIHGLIDLALVSLVVLVSQVVGISLADRGRDQYGFPVVVTTAYISMVFMMISMPSVLLREWLHPFLDNHFGFLSSGSDTPWLCVFSPLEDIGPGIGDASRWLSHLDNAFRIAVLENIALLSMVVFCLVLRSIYYHRSRIRNTLRRLPQAAMHHLTGIRQPIRTIVWSLCLVTFATFSSCTESPEESIVTADADEDSGPCDDPTKVREYWVESRNIGMVLNRFGDRDPNAYMYVGGGNEWASVDKRWDAIEAQLNADSCTNWGVGGTEEPHVPCVAPGLGFDREIQTTRRKKNLELEKLFGGTDLVQPLIMRANIGQCVKIHFRNSLDGKLVKDPVTGLVVIPTDGFASLQLQGLAHSVVKKVGGKSIRITSPKDAMAKRIIVGEETEELIFTIPIPNDPNAERSYYFSDGGGNRQRIAHGLFGALVIEPEGAEYYDTEIENKLLVDGIGWQAIIRFPDDASAGDRKEPDFREFVLMYHEVGDENFAGIIDGTDDNINPLSQIFGGAEADLGSPEKMLGPLYRISGRAINYRSESFHHRLTQDTGFEQLKSLGYSSYTFGDPATPIPRSYLGEPTKTRLMHGGSEVFHVHHLHGGADRWRRNPNNDPNNDISNGLTKRPVQQVFSTHLDSQSIGPGTSYNLEHECGAGGCQQAAGDFLYHCHIGQHYLAGMWGFWRVYDTLQSVEHPTKMGPLQSPLAPVPGYAPKLAVTANMLIDSTFNGQKIRPEDLKDWVSKQLPPKKPTTIFEDDKKFEKEESERYQLSLVVEPEGDLAANGKYLVIVGLVGTDLGIRIFGASGERVVDKKEADLESGDTLTALKQLLDPLTDVSSLSDERKSDIIADAALIAGHTLGERRPWDQDATFWDWTIEEGNSPGEFDIVGEVEIVKPWQNYTSNSPGERPSILFNQENGRYAWPLFRPHLGKRPPFAPKGHSGTPWLPANGPSDEQVAINDKTLDWDGLCPNANTPDRPDSTNPDDPHNVIPDQHKRYYPISAVPIDIYKYDPNDQLKNLEDALVDLRKDLEEEEDSTRKEELKDNIKLRQQERDEVERKIKIGFADRTTTDTTGQLFVLNEDILKIRDSGDPSEGTVVLRDTAGLFQDSIDPNKEIDQRAVQPLAIRSNVGDCTNVILTSKLKDKSFGTLMKRSKVNIHTHFVQFDPQSSDGVITGYSYEQSVRPYDTEKKKHDDLKTNDHLQRKLLDVSADGTTIVVNQGYRLYKGIWLGIGLGEGMCGRKSDEEDWKCEPEDAFAAKTEQHTEIRLIESIVEGLTTTWAATLEAAGIDDCKPRKDDHLSPCFTITLDQKLKLPHKLGEAVGVEFVQYSWYSDVDTGTVFFHDHVDFNSWDLGLVGAHIIEPEYSIWRDPKKGNPVRSGTIVDIIQGKDHPGKMSIGPGQEGSFREFVLMQHKKQNAKGDFGVNAATINLKAEPIQALKSNRGALEKVEGLIGRKGEPAQWFSSVIHGDPFTPMPRAYVGDPFVIRHLGVHDRVSAMRVTGHRFRQERWGSEVDPATKEIVATGALSDTSPIGISERFDLVLDGGAGGTQKKAGDYLYYSTTGRDLYDGAWGLIRVYNARRDEDNDEIDKYHLMALPERTPPTKDQLPAGEVPFPFLTSADKDNIGLNPGFELPERFKLPDDPYNEENGEYRDDGICPEGSAENRSTYITDNDNGLHIGEETIQRSDRNGNLLVGDKRPDLLHKAVVYNFSGDVAQFELTGQSLDNLEVDGVPDEILDKLKALEDKTFHTEGNFLEAVKQAIGDDQIDLYEERILIHANATWGLSEPFVLRVNHGKCLQVTLHNDLEDKLDDISNASKGAGRAFENWGRAGLNVGELQFNPQTSYGAAIGLNRDSSVGPGDTRTYRFYADRELGTTIALNLANPVHAAKGAFGAVIVEPKDSLYRFPEEGRGFLDIVDDLIFDDTINTGGVRADIYKEGNISGAFVDLVMSGERTFLAQPLFREFVTVFNDSDPVIGHNDMRYPTEADCRENRFIFTRDEDRETVAAKFKGCLGSVMKDPDDRPNRHKRLSLFSSVNYKRNRWRDRNLSENPSWIYLTEPRNEGGKDVGIGLKDPGVLITGPVGKKLRLRVAAPWGEQPHVFGLSGYSWRLEPEMENSEHVFSRFLAPGYSFDADLGQFGGPYKIEGDSLILDRRLPFAKAGLWGLIRSCSEECPETSE